MITRSVVAIALAALSACGPTSGIDVREAVVAEPVGPVTAGYFELQNHSSRSDRLVGVTCDIARAEIHRSFSEDGTMHMEPVGEVEIRGGEVVAFQPGGLHIMLFDVADLRAGDTVDIVLEFQDAGLVEVEARVRPYSELLP